MLKFRNFENFHFSPFSGGFSGGWSSKNAQNLTFFVNFFDVFSFKWLKTLIDVEGNLDLSNYIVPTLFHKSCEKKLGGKWPFFNGKWCSKFAL